MKSTLENQILSIQFHRPDAGNSFGIDEAKALLKIVSGHKKTARAFCFSSAHPALFCAGGDLKTHQKLKSKAAGIAQAREIRKTLAALADWPIPKVAFVNGDCFGGGMELLSCFDHRIARPHVMFGFWQRRIALSFGWGGYERWRERISSDHIKDLAFSGRVFGAQEALRVGVIHEIGDFYRVKSWLQKSLQWSGESAKALAQLTVANETKTFESLWWTAPHVEKIKKF